MSQKFRVRELKIKSAVANRSGLITENMTSTTPDKLVGTTFKAVLVNENGEQVVGPESPSGPGGTSTSNITQTAHGFALLDWLRFDEATSTWVKAQADDADHLGHWHVIEVIDANNFVVTKEGVYSISNSLTKGEYILSSSTAGAYTQTIPTVSGELVLYGMEVINANTISLYTVSAFINSGEAHKALTLDTGNSAELTLNVTDQKIKLDLSGVKGDIIALDTRVTTLEGNTSTEAIQDAAALLFTHTNHTNVSVSYDDAANQVILGGFGCSDVADCITNSAAVQNNLLNWLQTADPVSITGDWTFLGDVTYENNTVTYDNSTIEYTNGTELNYDTTTVTNHNGDTTNYTNATVNSTDTTYNHNGDEINNTNTTVNGGTYNSTTLNNTTLNNTTFTGTTTGVGGQQTIAYTAFEAIDGSPVPKTVSYVNNITGTSTIFANVGDAPIGIAFDTTGNLYVANSGSNNVSKIAPDGTSIIFANTGDDPYYLVFDTAGNLYVANSGSNNVSKIAPDGTSTIFANVGDHPRNIIIDANGDLYVSNHLGNNISKITPAGVSSIFANTGDDPWGLVFDTAGNLYVANSGSNNVSKIAPDGTSTLFANVGTFPYDITIDANDNLYVANASSNNISKITPAGVSSIFATTGDHPRGLVFDTAGNLYTVNEFSDNVSKIAPDGTSIIFANTGDDPWGLVFDTAGNLYVSNYGSDNVSKITVIQAGQGVHPYSTTNPNYIGVVKDDVTLNDTANVIVSGVVDGFIGLVVGSQYKAKPTGDIEVTTTAIEVIGRAVSTTKLLLS